MGKTLFILILLFLGKAQAEEIIPLSRYITVTTCYNGKGCIGPVAKKVKDANVSLKLEPFERDFVFEPGTQNHLLCPQTGEKIPVKGLHVSDYHLVTDEGVPFRGEIHINKINSPKGKYHVYMVLRTGSLKSGTTATYYLQDLSELKEKVLQAEAVPFAGGTLQAQLVVGPPLKLSR